MQSPDKKKVMIPPSFREPTRSAEVQRKFQRVFLYTERGIRF